MAKRLSRKKKWRHVYPYICVGCGKKRIAFAHERARAAICKNCEPQLVPENQDNLFKEI